MSVVVEAEPKRGGLTEVEIALHWCDEAERLAEQMRNEANRWQLRAHQIRQGIRGVAL